LIRDASQLLTPVFHLEHGSFSAYRIGLSASQVRSHFEIGCAYLVLLVQIFYFSRYVMALVFVGDTPTQRSFYRTESPVAVPDTAHYTCVFLHF
jgi:hypothetical protein